MKGELRIVVVLTFADAREGPAAPPVKLGVPLKSENGSTGASNGKSKPVTGSKPASWAARNEPGAAGTTPVPYVNRPKSHTAAATAPPTMANVTRLLCIWGVAKDREVRGA